MQPTDDNVLLRQFAENQSDEAFAALVARHVNLVYSVALRSVGNPHNAEEIAQAVFVILAKKAAGLRHERALSSWLFHTTRLTADNFLRSEIRRHHREQEAYMQTILNEPGNEVWQKIAPLVDGAVAGLREKDRQAILLRFYEGRNLREVGLALDISEDAAEKRVGRALDKLRKIFTRRGVSSTTAILAGTISAHSVQAAPVGLAKTISAVAIGKSAAVSTSTLTLIKGALKIMAWTKAKTAIVAVATVIAATGTTTLVVHHHPRVLPKAEPVVPTESGFSRSSWHFAGYDSPESALMSMVWAVGNNDGHTFRNSLAPAMQQQFVGKADRDVIDADDKRDFARITGYRVLDKQVLSENEVVLTGFAVGLNETQKFRFQRLGDEWKYNGR